mgnify:CR=1 FL=1
MPETGAKNGVRFTFGEDVSEPDPVLHISNLNSRVMNFTERLRGMKPAAKAIFRTLAAWGVVDYAESNISINTLACRADPGCNELRAK